MTNIKKIIIVIIIIVSVSILIFFIKHQIDNDFEQLQQQATHNFPLQKDSKKKIVINSDIDLIFISDSLGNIHYFLFNKNKLITTNIIGNTKKSDNFFNEKEVYWTYYNDPNNNNIFIGSIMNKQIAKIEVNDLRKDDMHYLEYQGQLLFYTTVILTPPLLIRGYSANNTIIYQNH